MSAFGGKADVSQQVAECLLIAKSGPYATGSLRKECSSPGREKGIRFFGIFAYLGNVEYLLNRAQKRRQQKLSKKTQSLASASGQPGVNAPEIQQSLDLAVQHHTAGRLPEAESIYQQILQVDPNQPVALHLLGVIAHQVGNHNTAVDLITKAIDIETDYADAHSNLGNALRELGRLHEAMASYHKALAIRPNHAEAHNNLGNILQDLGKLDEAIATYRNALDINPDYAEALNNMGNALKDLGRLDGAVVSYNKALTIKPDYAEAHNNLANVLKELGRLDEAITSYRNALSIRSDLSGAGRNLLNVMLNVPGMSPKELFDEHLGFTKRFKRHITPIDKHFPNDPTPDRQLRVGYLSSDFRIHPVGENVLPLISSHDREKFEVFCYADVTRPDAITERFQSCVDHWHPIVGKSDAEVARMVRADGIDVLVSLAGRFDANRPLVCAYRAAPVQVSFHDGATSGLEEMDYWLTDDFLHPPDTKELFTEDLHRLPVLYQYLPIENAPTVGPLPADQAGFITFGSFNNPAKINEEVIGLWAEVLQSVPGSKILLKYKTLYGQASLQGSVVERFSASGIGQDRITFSALSDTFAKHLGRYDEVDIALDPFPFNGATTTFQALWMGVPVISLAGEAFISRAAGSLLHQVGLGDLTVNTPKAYLDCARDLAGNLEQLRTLRANLRERMTASPLCNAPTYALSVEAAYWDMWGRWCAEQENTP
jgi:predicted O-linked N-acetylglucosamine transferase (SPINDLY family)